MCIVWKFGEIQSCNHGDYEREIITFAKIWQKICRFGRYVGGDD